MAHNPTTTKPSPTRQKQKRWRNGNSKPTIAYEELRVKHKGNATSPGWNKAPQRWVFRSPSPPLVSIYSPLLAPFQGKRRSHSNWILSNSLLHFIILWQPALVAVRDPFLLAAASPPPLHPQPPGRVVWNIVTASFECYNSEPQPPPFIYEATTSCAPQARTIDVGFYYKLQLQATDQRHHHQKIELIEEFDPKRVSRMEKNHRHWWIFLFKSLVAKLNDGFLMSYDEITVIVSMIKFKLKSSGQREKANVESWAESGLGI